MHYLFSLQDPAITTSMPVLDLVDCIKPGSVVYDNVASGSDEEVRIIGGQATLTGKVEAQL